MTSTPVKIQSGTITSQTELIFTNLSASYIKYELIISGLKIATGTQENLVIRTSTDNGATFTAGTGYDWRQQFAGSTQTVRQVVSSAQSEIVLLAALNPNAADENVATVYIFNPMDATDKTTVLTTTGGRVNFDSNVTEASIQVIGGQRNAAEANNAVRIFMGNGSTFSMDYLLLGHSQDLVSLATNIISAKGKPQPAGYPAADATKLAGIEAGANVTSTSNVISSLNGAAITAVTVATNDKVLIQDVSDSNNLKTVTTQSIANLAAPVGTLIGIQVFKSGGTYTPTSGSTHQRLKLWGAGGGGGTTNSANSGSGGGGGAYVEAYIANSASQTITIGAGGTAGGANNGTAAGNGGATSFSSIAVAAGGTAGASAGGGGGVGGTIAACTVPSGGFAMPGAAGGSYYGGSLPLNGGSTFGNLPPVFGAANFGLSGIANTGMGGGGGTSTIAGGVGGSGLVIIEEYA